MWILYLWLKIMILWLKIWEPTINENEGAPLENEQVGIEENEAPPANDRGEEPQQEIDDEPQPTRRS
jgi:hypothetical protein